MRGCLALVAEAGDPGRTIAFYAELGFSVAERHLNRGEEQMRMDGVPGAVVEVTTLMPSGGAPPHLELLCYREPSTIAALMPDGSPLATMVKLACSGNERLLVDPDSHRLLMGAGWTGPAAELKVDHLRSAP